MGTLEENVGNGRDCVREWSAKNGQMQEEEEEEEEQQTHTRDAREGGGGGKVTEDDPIMETKREKRER